MALGLTLMNSHFHNAFFFSPYKNCFSPSFTLSSFNHALALIKARL